MTRRQLRLNEQFREEISELLMHHLHDPRLAGLVSITHVSISPDMRYATVFISALGDEEQKQSVLQGMTAASGFIRHELGQRLAIRYIPALDFKWDDSIEQSVHISELIKQASATDSKKTLKKNN